MRRRFFAAVLVALMGALFSVSCATDSGSGSPIAPSGPADQPTYVRPTKVTQSNGLPIEDGTTIPVDASVVVDLQYVVSSVDRGSVPLSEIDVAVCLSGPVEGTVLATSCDINGYKTSGKDTFYVSQSKVNVSERLRETYSLGYYIVTGFHTVSPDKAIPPNSGNYLITDAYTVLGQGKLNVKIAWVP